MDINENRFIRKLLRTFSNEPIYFIQISPKTYLSNSTKQLMSDVDF